MPKRILLVDDEELFLKSLKEGLEPLSHVFEVDICYSVNEAIKSIAVYDYDLVVTDMRMPEKSGLELLLFLKERKFPGKIIVMSAYDTDENSDKIKSLGVIDVITKPFRLEFFKNMLLEQFRLEKDGSVLFETIDLVTVMQVINMEKKTSALEVDVDGNLGMIFFMDGEIVHAEFDDLEGEEAVLKLIAQPSGRISVRKIKNKVKRTIKTPFVKHMMNIMQTVDEIRRVEESSEALKREANPPLKPLPGFHVDKKAMKDALETLNEVNGFIAAGMFSAHGELMVGTDEISRFHFEKSGAVMHEILRDAKIMSSNMALGKVEMFQVHSELGVIFAMCACEGDIHFHIILIIEPSGNVGMAKIRLNKVVDSLKTMF